MTFLGVILLSEDEFDEDESEEFEDFEDDFFEIEEDEEEKIDFVEIETLTTLTNEELRELLVDDAHIVLEPLYRHYQINEDGWLDHEYHYGFAFKRIKLR
jgi:hypothetical protein